MSKINILDEQSANMIAAGEVVERPSGALKEILENAIDAGADKIRACIKNGGTVQISVTDNGEGISAEDLPKCILRHATGKIKSGADLAGVKTLGFRGEALAAIAAVSELKIISKQAGFSGNMLSCADGRTEISEIGCPDGTSVCVDRLFYNVPARRKFLKTDGAETAACNSAAMKIALSRPDIALTFTADGTEKFRTPGDGELYSAIYAVFGRKVASGMRSVDYESDGIRVIGYISVPENSRGSRSMQYSFVNDRSVISKTITAAAEEAGRSYLAGARFPAFVLKVYLNPEKTDVNVHPAKTEIKFENERAVFSTVYYAVKNAYARLLTENEEKEKEKFKNPDFTEIKPEFASPVRHDYIYQAPEKPENEFKTIFNPGEIAAEDLKGAIDSNLILRSPQTGEEAKRDFADTVDFSSLSDIVPESANEKFAPDFLKEDANQQKIINEEGKKYRYIGEIYDAFLIAETPEKIIFVDKHALHERILYEKIAKRKQVNSQRLLSDIIINLNDAQAEILAENADYLKEFGFEIKAFGDKIAVSAVPDTLIDISNLPAVIEKFAFELSEGNAVAFKDKVDRALFTVACKAALKAGIKNDPVHNKWLLDRYFESASVRYCPHGRPVSRELSKREIEKFFDR